MNLYFLSGDDQDGESLSLHVVANSPQDAHYQWKKHWFEDDEVSAFDVPIIFGDPESRVEDKLLIYELDYDPDTRGVIGWGREARSIGYVEPC